ERGTVPQGEPAGGRQAPKPQGIAELGGKFSVELEAPPRQSIERATAAPVERQKAARFAGGRTADLVTLDDGRARAASACEVSDRSADRATTADHDARARTHSSYGVRLHDAPTGAALALKMWPTRAAGASPSGVNRSNTSKLHQMK